MPFLTPPLSMAGLNQTAGPHNFVLETPNSQAGQPMHMVNGFESPEMSLKTKNNICKSFEDDLFFCPRGLLSSQELSTCQQMDLLLLDQMRDITAMHAAQTADVGIPDHAHSQPKFNPYTSQSFSPAPPPLESRPHLRESTL
ncbi:LAQU0S08e03048g1_1 [Lachancea quebecensis]|uniref:LAQU0S08e03048g1_1 n=1 Tax=Lachancea quebecensis TaxID=1654605 RepID=A0A0P1KTX7_9SACH|nr:LAQU0S08e03048g1_1 [Lachancea quebecensis]